MVQEKNLGETTESTKALVATLRAVGSPDWPAEASAALAALIYLRWLTTGPSAPGEGLCPWPFHELTALSRENPAAMVRQLRELPVTIQQQLDQSVTTQPPPHQPPS